jgi:hypothetical protein
MTGREDDYAGLGPEMRARLDQAGDLPARRTGPHR